jgi:hypothetical protein
LVDDYAGPIPAVGLPVLNFIVFANPFDYCLRFKLTIAKQPEGTSSD